MVLSRIPPTDPTVQTEDNKLIYSKHQTNSYPHGPTEDETGKKNW